MIKREEVMKNVHEMQFKIIEYIEASGISEQECFDCILEIAISLLISNVDFKNTKLQDCLDNYESLINKVFVVGSETLLAAKLREDFKV